MTALPKGWVEVRLGELGEWRGGGTPSKSRAEFWQNGSIPWVSPKDMKSYLIDKAEDSITPSALQGSTTNLIYAGSVLIVSRSGILRHTLPVGVTAVDVTINQDLKALTPAAGVDSDFAAKQVIAKSQDILRTCAKAGTTVDSVDFDRLKEFPIALPPLAEQKRIVAKVESVTAKSARARDQLSRISLLVQKYKGAVLVTALRGNLTIDWRRNFGNQNLSAKISKPAPVHRVRRSVPESVIMPDCVSAWKNPADWRLAHVGRYLIDGEIVDVKDGNHGTNHPRREEFTSVGLPFITAAQLTDDVFSADTSPRVSGKPLEKLKVGFAEPRDVILSHKGTVGRVAICTESCVLSPQTTYYRASPDAFLAEFLRLMMISPFFKRQLDEVKSQTTRDFVPISGQYELFLLRPPLDEQLEIVRRVETAFAKIDRLAAEAKRALELTDRLDEKIIAKAFRGELVPQDPNDEPASALLERIRAERAAAPKAKRGRKAAGA